MSEQIFTGLAPTAPEGRELLLHSLDSWIALHEAIQRLVVEDFPFCPAMTAESAANLAQVLTESIADGLRCQIPARRREKSPSMCSVGKGR